MNNNLPALRAMGMPELLDQTILIYRRDFLKFIGIIAIPYIPLVLVQGVLTYFTGSSSGFTANGSIDPLSLASIGGMIIVGIVQFFLVEGVATAAMTRAIADRYIGRNFDILGAYSGLKGSWGRLILALIIMFVLLFLALLWLIVPCAGWLTGIGLSVFLGAAVMPLIAPVVVLEQEGVFSSIRRAWDLARLRFWWLLGYLLVITLFGQLIVTGPVFVVSAGLEAAFSTMDLSLNQTMIWTTIVQTLVGMVSTLLFSPLKLIAITMAYMDLRVRFEGLDLLAPGGNAVEGDDAPDFFVPHAAPSPPKPLVTWLDAGYFTMLSFAAGLLYLLFGPFIMFLGLMFIGLSAQQGL